MKKILLSCVTCLLAVGLLAGCDNEEEVVTPEDPNAGVVEPGGDEGGGSAKEIVFGFEVEGVMNYIDGGTFSNYSYEGTLTTDLAKAARITLQESGTEGAYYVSFDNGGTTNWITIVDNSGHTNFGYVTTKSLLYYNAEYECWGDETLNYFLCCNTTWGCFYCSALSEYGPDSTKPSPIATLYYTDGSVVSGLKGYTYNAPAPTEITISGLSYVLAGETTQLTASVNAGANPSVNWTIALPEGATEGEVVSNYASIDGNGLVSGISAYEGLVVTATSAVDASVSDTFTISVVEVALPKTDDEPDTTYKLGALDTNDYVYRWFTGETTGSTYLLAGDSYDDAADIYMTEQTIPGISSAYTLSLLVEDELVYISNNGSSTSVTLSSSPCIWVWNAELAVYAQGTESGRSLVLYTSKVTDKETEVETVTYSFRAYTQTDTNLAYPRAALYETEAKVADISTITVSAEEGATSVEVGKTLQLTATVSPEDADPRVTWSVGESDEQYATVDENGLVTGVAVCDSVTITATSVANPSITGTINIAVTKTEPLQEGMIGYFDFSTNEKNGTAISSSSDLDSFWSGEEGLYRGISVYDTVYLGNGTNGAFDNVTSCIKFGTQSANGTLQLKFAVGTCISEVVVTAHSWNKITDDYPEQTPNQLVVNGESQDCSVTGEATELTYTITGDLVNYVTFESVGRVTIHSIDVYGTYEPETIEKASVTLVAENVELMAGATTDITLAWETSILYGPEDFEWKSDTETVATVENGVVTGVGEGKANISATLIGNEDVTGSIEITVTVATAKVLTYSYTFNNQDLGPNSTGSKGSDRSTEAGTSISLGGLVWNYSAAIYKGYDTSNTPSKGIQIGVGNENEGQTTTPFTISTDFGESVKLTAITLKLGVASGGSAKYSITHDSYAVATDVAFTNTAVTDYTHSNLSYEGEVLTISLLSTVDKAMYIQGISLTIEVGLESTLSFD